MRRMIGARRRVAGLLTAALATVIPAASPAVATAPAEPTAAERGADLVYSKVDGDFITRCQLRVHVDSDSTATAPVDIGCPGEPVRAVHAGVRSVNVGTYGPNARMALWDDTGVLLGTLRGSKGECFTTGGDSDWRLLCSPVSATSLVSAYGLARSKVRLFSTTAAPRTVAVVPYLAGGVVSHDGSTLFAWTEVGPDTYPQPAHPARSTVRDVDLASGRQTVRARAPKGRMYDVVCATWDGTVVASVESWRKNWNRRNHGLVTISPDGAVRSLAVGYPTSAFTVGCTADGRTLVWIPADWNDERTFAYDTVTGTSTVVASARAYLVDNA